MILRGSGVKDKLLAGINLVANTVKPTLGPQAKTVILQNNPPIIVNDGVTITKHISHEDPYVQMGIQMVQNLASEAQDSSGDGTTTACVLAQALCQSIYSMEGLTSTSTHEFYHMLESFKDNMISVLEERAVPITDEGIYDVAKIAANNDHALGSLISDAIAKVGREGIVTVEESNSHRTELVLREGMQLTEGYISHLMANTADGRTIFKNPLIFMSNLKFRNFKDLITLLEFASQQGRPLVIFCRGMDGSALNNLLMNIMNKNVECVVCLAPNFGDQQLDELGDIQATVGGTIFTEESKDDPKVFVEDDLGTCETVIVSKERTILVGAEAQGAEDRIQYLRGMVEEIEGFEAARIKSRIARLKGGVATIKVGASSSMEMIEKKERLDDALNATRAALSEGIVVGGGTTLMHCANSIDCPDWLKEAMGAPYRTLYENSNLAPKQLPDYPLGFNALLGKITDLEKDGVYDPVKVTKSSFLAAMSIAQLFYSTEVAVLVEE
jgi:chaperonin GroEL